MLGHLQWHPVTLEERFGLALLRTMEFAERHVNRLLTWIARGRR